MNASEKLVYDKVNIIRKDIKSVAAFTKEQLVDIKLMDKEVGANLMLAYRHLEDASMRLGKALQALDGGVSVYDRDTTVGA